MTSSTFPDESTDSDISVAAAPSTDKVSIYPGTAKNNTLLIDKFNADIQHFLGDFGASGTGTPKHEFRLKGVPNTLSSPDAQALFDAHRLLLIAAEYATERTDTASLAFPVAPTVESAQLAIGIVQPPEGESPQSDSRNTKFALLASLLHDQIGSVRALAVEALGRERSDASRRLLEERAVLEQSKFVSALIKAVLHDTQRDK